MERLPSRVLTWLLVVAVLIVAGVSAYFAGTVSESAARARDAAAAAQRYSVVDGKLRSAQTDIASLQSVNQLLRADLWIYRAAAELDARNFGRANEAVAKTVAALNAVNPTAAGIEAAPLTAVRAEAASVNIAVATDLGAQRAQLLRLAADVNVLVESLAAARGRR
jgi:hypothetical protein